MAINTSLSAIRPNEFGYPQAQHLLNRAGFGGSPSQIAMLQNMGIGDAVDLLVDYETIDESSLPTPPDDPDILRNPTPIELKAARDARRRNDLEALNRIRADRQAREAEDRRQMAEIEQWWLARMIQTPRPLEEKLTLLWHGHFASKYRTVSDSYLMLRQNQFFRENASKSFSDLAAGIVRDPAMIKFLNNNSNRKAKPNENLGRELMELFTLGVGNYTEADIKEGARALTGYTFNDNDFVFQSKQHDDGVKTILGKRGNWNGDDFVQILLENSACPRFVAYKLYKHFVSDMPGGSTRDSINMIEQIAKLLIMHDYQIKPVLKVIFKSRHFYDAAIMGNMIKSPVQLVVGTARALEAPVRDLGVLTEALARMGQKLFDPPSVAGWEGGRSWINTSTLYVRQNLAAYLITGKLPYDDGWDHSKISYDPEVMLAPTIGRSPQSVVEHLSTTMLGGHVLPQRREQLLSLVEHRNNVTADGILGLLSLITALPEYQLC